MAPLVMPDESTMIQRMYTEMIGIDGQGGLVNNQRVIRRDVEWIKENMVTEEECTERRLSYKKEKEIKAEKDVSKRRNTWLIVKDVVLVSIAFISVLVTLGVIGNR